jgi:hypothetical protein
MIGEACIFNPDSTVAHLDRSNYRHHDVDYEDNAYVGCRCGGEAKRIGSC